MINSYLNAANAANPPRTLRLFWKLYCNEWCFNQSNFLFLILLMYPAATGAIVLSIFQIPTDM